ncbi:fimbria/pilus outer membrane usher protein [Burkholderia anthina]|uniref:fimbria/pilus outer membrane usher protein n=1 Tax=Burkholderia anthina TaxID=179879 RepID=UPI001FC88950|nr:fimbria/pilus outer membrane usher protein [Burkholderia anthina]
MFILAAIGSWAAEAHASTALARPDDSYEVAQVHFNDTLMMKPRGQRLDLERFSKENPVVPGDYLVDVFVNGQWSGRSTVRFTAADSATSAKPCFDAALVMRLGLNDQALSDSGRAELARVRAGECTDVAKLVDEASYVFDMSELRLDVSIPQVALLRNPRGYVSPELLDRGVPAATLKYSANVFRSASHGYDATQAYVGIVTGVNVASWHFRHNGTYTAQSNGESRYQSLNTYVQRDIPSWRSQLKVGEVYTDGTLFDSVGLRGATLESDDRMLPDSMRGYAPVVRGVASSNAHVEVSQNGSVLYETNVAPGPFQIDDLYPTGYGGNLIVTVTEADGKKHSFTVPYAAVAQSLRPGLARFGVAVGQLRESQLNRHPNFVQATYQRGINNMLTGYAGAVFMKDYLSGLVGIAFNTRLGAVAIDITQARANIPGESDTSGQSVRVSYSKLVEETGTNVALAAYRYSSSGYWAVRDAMYAREHAEAGGKPAIVYRQRNQLQLTLNQDLGERFGSVFAVGSMYSYWNRQGTSTQFQLGYNNRFRVAGVAASYNLSLSRQRDGFGGSMSNMVYANLSIPLGRRSHAPTLSASVMRDGSGSTSTQMSLNGTAGKFSAFSYNVSASRDGQGTAASGNAQYRGPYAMFSGSAGGGKGYSSISMGVSGAVVGHAGGVTLANDLGETLAIVEAKDAVGAHIMNGTDVRIDRRGYAVLPYLTPYQMNTIDLDPKGIPLDVEMLSTSQQVAPRAGSVVKVRFATVSGRAALLTVRRTDGTPVPFGSMVSDASGKSIGTLGQGGRLFVRGLDDTGTLIAKWGERMTERCEFTYRLPAGTNSANAYTRADAVCDVRAENMQGSAATVDQSAAVDGGRNGASDRTNAAKTIIED